MEKYSLSIIIPAKNEEKQLPRLLGSIKKQAFSDYEIIVADAGSADKTKEVSESFGAKVVKGGMPGPGRNRGAEAASGEILLFLDADEILSDPDFLRKSLEEMKGKDFCIAAPFFDFYDATMADKIVSCLWNAWVSIASHLYPSATGSCIFAAKKIHDKIGGFNEKIVLGEDTDYAYRASRHCRFGIIKTTRINNSPRRLHKEGHLKVFLQVIGAGFQRFILGKTDYGNNFDYKFDIYNDGAEGNKKNPDKNLK